MAEADPFRQDRTLTERGLAHFEQRSKYYHDRLSSAWSHVEPLLRASDTDPKQLRHDICLRYEHYRMLCDDYKLFLETNRTEISSDLLKEHDERCVACDIDIQNVLRQLDSKLHVLEEARRSVHSVRSRSLTIRSEEDNRSIRSVGPSIRSAGSRSTHSSSSLATAKAKLEAAKARMVISKKQSELKKKQASLQETRSIQLAQSERESRVIEAELSLMEDEKLLAEAEAESNFLETVSEWPERESIDRHSAENLEQQPVSPPQHVYRQPVQTAPQIIESSVDRTRQYVNEHSATRQFGQYLAKKDLLLSRFQKFSDEPANFHLWKLTFKSIINELCVSPQEEIDLLVKWLGPESSKQALSLRVANVHNPDGGLEKIWKRLDERYGAPELVESSLRKRLDQFPKITKDYKKLYDLCDLLSEIESVKENQSYAALLGSYDSPVGVNTVLAKLPFHIQNKWSDRGRKFKVANGVAYPPFTYFVSFVRDMCSLFNDPSFQVDAVAAKDTPRATRHIQQHVSAKKGEVTITDTKCPLHINATHSHTLQECREFRKKPIEERRQILKDKKLCFKCCVTDKHSIKECKTELKCDHCSSTKHSTAMHIDKPPPTTVTTSKPNGGERSPGEKSETVNCKFSQICSDPTLSKSCAKIVKAYVYPKDSPQNKIKLYAIVDDQSNKTLASPGFFDAFRDECKFKEVQYQLSTCGGSVNTSGRIGERFVIQSVDGHCLDLPDITECSEIPDNRDEIPTPEIACKYPHLRHVATSRFR